MHEPSITVVIPVKNDARYLARCLLSLAAQTVPIAEIIVVDNGSSDDSRAVALDAGVTVLDEPRPGIAAASGTGYDRAQGSIIARIDADTRVGPGWAATLLAEFAARPQVDVVTGGADFIDGPPVLRRVASHLYLGAYFALAALALTHVPVFGSNFAMRRGAWLDVRDDIHGSDRLHDDFDLSYHLGLRHRIRYLRALRVGISMRPLFERDTLRARRGISTVTIHWPHDLPWLRLARRALPAWGRSGRAAARAAGGG